MKHSKKECAYCKQEIVLDRNGAFKIHVSKNGKMCRGSKTYYGHQLAHLEPKNYLLDHSGKLNQ